MLATVLFVLMAGPTVYQRAGQWVLELGSDLEFEEVDKMAGLLEIKKVVSKAERMVAQMEFSSAEK